MAGVAVAAVVADSESLDLVLEDTAVATVMIMVVVVVMVYSLHTTMVELVLVVFG